MTSKIGASVLSGLLLAALPLASPVAKPLPERSLVMGMVIHLGEREEIVATGEAGLFGSLRASGISEEEITDGSVAVAMIYCCRGKFSRTTMLYFYVPAELALAEGDVVEIELGRGTTRKQRKQGDRGTLNRASRVRDSFEQPTGACRWDPENDALWMRVIYCDWMLGEGWLQRGGLDKHWYRPPRDD